MTRHPYPYIQAWGEMHAYPQEVIDRVVATAVHDKAPLTTIRANTPTGWYTIHEVKNPLLRENLFRCMKAILSRWATEEAAKCQ